MTARQDFLEPLLDRMSADGASDLLLAAGHAPTLFVPDQPRPAGPGGGPIDATTLETIMKEVAGEEAWSEFIKAARDNRYRTLKHRLSHGGHEFLVTAADGGILTARFRLITRRRSSFETISRLEVMALKIADLQS